MTSLPVFMQAVKELFVAGPHRCRLVQDYHIEALEVRPVLPKGFPYKPLQPVATDCTGTVFLGNSQAEPCIVLVVIFVKNRKHHVAATLCFFEDAAVGGRIKKPASPSEAAVRHSAGCGNFFRWIVTADY